MDRIAADLRFFNMRFSWQFPNPPLDVDALQRMRHHFVKPSQSMPEAWFMGDIRYFTWLDRIPPEELMKEDRFGHALDEIAGGVFAFPKAKYVWKEWFKYLLPYAIAEAGNYFSYYCDPVLSLTIPTLIAFYPDGIVEEYTGFRDDVLDTLGTRYYCRILPDDRPLVPNAAYPLLPDSWDFANCSGVPLPSLREDFGLAMTFCLKYLTPSEIENWVQSLISIDNPQWHLAIIRCWLAIYTFLEQAHCGSDDADIGRFFEEPGFFKVSRFAHRRFGALDAFIPPQNFLSLRSALSRQLTIDRFQSWAADIRSHAMSFQDGTHFTIGEYFSSSLESL
ncbi:MAG: hypothetical protein ACYDBJ_21275, partial [Aggregatilineales bacterium]